MIGVAMPRSRSSRQIWAPFNPGRFMSRTMRSKASINARSRPFVPSRSTVMSYPSGSRASTNRSAFIASSSTSKIRKGGLPRHDIGQPLDQPDAVDRLREVLVRAERPALPLVVLHGHDYHRDVLGQRAHGAQDRLAAAIRQTQIEHDGDGRRPPDRRERGVDRSRDLHAEADLRNERDDEVRIAGVVLDAE